MPRSRTIRSATANRCDDGLLVELGERPLVGERDPRDQLGETGVAATGSTAIA
jgi:hypothetical protein